MLKCNINKTDRINRIIIGVCLFLATVLNMSKIFFMIISMILIIEGLIGWCSIPYLIAQIKKK